MAPVGGVKDAVAFGKAPSLVKGTSTIVPPPARAVVVIVI